MLVSRALDMIVAERERVDAEMARRLAERDTLHLGHVDRIVAQAAAEPVRIGKARSRSQ